MRSRRTRTAGRPSPDLLACFLGVLAASPAAASAQLPSASAAVLGTANNATARVRGFAAVGGNPAGLAMPGSPRFSVAVPAVQLRQGLSPVTLGDIDRFEGRFVPEQEREEWLNRIGRAGWQRGDGSLELSALSVSAGPLGFQISTVGVARANLNEDAAELLLFGNAGRTGTPRDFHLQNSSLDGSVLTTLGVSAAFPLHARIGDAPQQAMAVGATLKYTIGNALLLARDAGSLVASDPISVDIAFPVLQTDTAFDDLSNGGGFGLDVGVAWEGGPLALAVVIENVFHTFAWDVDALLYRRGEALFDADGSSSDFDARPASEAPSTLRDEVAAQTFDPRLGIGAAYRASGVFTLTADFWHRAGDGIELEPRTHAGVGAEYLPTPVLPLRAGVSYVTGGVQLGGGAGLVLGPVNVAGAALHQTRDGRGSSVFMLTLSFLSQ